MGSPEIENEEMRDSLVSSLEKSIKQTLALNVVVQEIQGKLNDLHDIVQANRSEILSRGFRWDKAVKIVVPEGATIVTADGYAVAGVTAFMADGISSMTEEGVEFYSSWTEDRMLVNHDGFELEPTDHAIEDIPVPFDVD